jgi:glycosyltransferase involved in cell wall biosynthesis
VRLGLDGTPLLGRRTGIGRYVAELLRALPGVAPDDELVVTAFTARGGGELATAVPPGVSARSRPVPARLLRAAWAHAERPSVQWLTGEVEVFHGTNFVLPPTGRAGGVVTVHDLAYLRMPEHVDATSRRLVDLVPRSLRRAGAVCVPSHAIAGEVEDAYPVVRGRIVVTPLGVDPAWQHAIPPSPAWLAARGIPSPYLLFAGTVEPRKDLGTLLTAYRRATASGDDVPALVLVGPRGWGDEDDAAPRPGERIVRLDHRPDTELRSLVAGARALVFPSLYEGFGLPLLEAFACGTPVVASDIPTTREVLGEAADLATLFAVGDADALTDRLLELAVPESDGPTRRERRRARAAGMTWARTAERTLTAYRQAVN